jgi:hypothetical protein
MALIILDRSHLAEESLSQVAQNTNLTHFAFGSKARLVHDVTNVKLSQQLDIFESNIDRAFLSGASGRLLDYIGELAGIERPKAQSANVSSEEKNFNFFTYDGTFGDINNSNDISIPQGTRVSNSLDSSSRVYYRTTEDILLPASENRFFFSARSEEQGADSNVGEHSLNTHNFTNYADILNNSLLVTNSSSISYGKDELDDESYRFLIQQQSLTNAKANFIAIDSSLRLIPGISDVKRVLYKRGIATADWIIKAVTPTIPDTLIQSAQKSIDETKADSLDHRAVAPDTIDLQLTISLTYKERFTSAEKNKIKTSVRKSLISYVNNLDIGQKLILDQLVKVILNSSDKIESVGTVSKKIDKLIIYKHSFITGSKIKKTLLADYNTTSYERVIIDPNTESPVTIFDNN